MERTRTAGLPMSYRARITWFLVIVAICLAAAITPWPKLIKIAALLLAVWTAWRAFGRPDNLPAEGRDVLPRVPKAVWFLLLATALLVRWMIFPRVHAWPFFDESLISSFALEDLAGNKAGLYYGDIDLPGMYILLMAAAYRLFDVSLATLWAVPAFLSSLALLLSVVLARRILKPGTAFGFACLAAFGYWPLVAGGLSLPGTLTIPWFYLCLLVLIRATPSPPEEGSRWPLLSGLLLGLGVYTNTSWMPLLPVLGALFAWRARRHPRTAWILFGFGMALALVPAARHFSGGGGRYIGELFLFNHMGSLSSWRAALSNVIQILGDPPEKGLAYSPVWGGFFNPVSAALILVGISHLFSRRREPLAAWLLISVLMVTSPGWLSTTVEMYRVFQSLPFFLLLAALGLSVVIGGRHDNKAWVFALAVLGVSTTWDTLHWTRGYRDAWGTGTVGDFQSFKTAEQLRAYRILSPWARREGPGELFLELVPETFDRSLGIACRPFDARKNRSLKDRRVRWRALLTDPHLKPHLERLLGPARWYWLSEGLNRVDGGCALGIFPVQPGDDAAWSRIRLADGYFSTLTDISIHGVRLDRPWEVMTRELVRMHPQVRGDRVLEFYYWRKMKRYRMGAWDRDGARQALMRALRDGIPAASLYAELGALAALEGDAMEAKRWFRKTRVCEPNLTRVPD